MRYAIRNLVRLRARAFLTFIIAFSVLFLSMFGLMVVKLCEDNRERFYGPLDGAVHVTNEAYEPYLTYTAAMTICEDADVITGISALKEYTGMIYGTQYVGWDQFTREAYSQELPIQSEEESLTKEDTTVHYHKGMMIVGVTDMNILEEVFSGNLVMTEGTMITAENNAAHHPKIVISKEYADQNGISPGDVLTLNTPSLYRTEHQISYAMNHEKNAEDSYAYTVGGIYNRVADNTASASAPWEANANRVYVPISTLLDISKSERIQTLYSYVTRVAEGRHVDRYRAINTDPSLIPDRLYFHVSDRGSIGALCDEINSLGFYENVLLTEYVSDAASSPSVRLSEMVSVILFGIGCIGLLIFMLVILFHMRARHKELAVLVALGKSRGAVTASFFIEIVGIVAMSVLASGVLLTLMVNILAHPINDYLYSAEASAKWRDMTSEMILLGHSTKNEFIGSTADRKYLFHTYVLPSFFLVFDSMMCVMSLIYFRIRFYVNKINALSDVGGKE